MSKQVAVIVSTYNSRDTLMRVLEAYRHQSSLPDELIVADDGSGDGTRESAAKFARTSPFTVKHIWQEDDGFRLARIRNLAIRSCESDYVIFTDGDCLPHPHFVADHLRVRREGSFVQGKRLLVGKEITATFSYQPGPQFLLQCLRGQLSGRHHLLRIPGLARPVKGLRGIRTANFAVHRADFIAVNGFNEDFTGWGREDSELVVRLYKYGLHRRDVSHSALIFHLWHPEADRRALAENDKLLEAAMRSADYRCRHGIDALDL